MSGSRIGFQEVRPKISAPLWVRISYPECTYINIWEFNSLRFSYHYCLLLSPSTPLLLYSIKLHPAMEHEPPLIRGFNLSVAAKLPPRLILILRPRLKTQDPSFQTHNAQLESDPDSVHSDHYQPTHPPTTGTGTSTQ